MILVRLLIVCVLFVSRFWILEGDLRHLYLPKLLFYQIFISSKASSWWTYWSFKRLIKLTSKLIPRKKKSILYSILILLFYNINNYLVYTYSYKNYSISPPSSSSFLLFDDNLNFGDIFHTLFSSPFVQFSGFCQPWFVETVKSRPLKEKIAMETLLESLGSWKFNMNKIRWRYLDLWIFVHFTLNFILVS